MMFGSLALNTARMSTLPSVRTRGSNPALTSVILDLATPLAFSIAR